MNSRPALLSLALLLLSCPKSRGELSPTELGASFGIVLAAAPAVGPGRTAEGELKIVDRPIRFGPQRTRDTLEYIRRHYDANAADIAIRPRMIVLHDTEFTTLSQSWNYFDNEALSGRAEIAVGGRVNVSAQFLVDRDGTVYRLMPEDRMARHVIGLNHCAIGVENVGKVNTLTPAQVEANVRLVRYLKARFPEIEHLIAHAEYQVYKRSPLWKALVPYPPTGKSDPGKKFMAEVRAKLKRAGLVLRSRP
ncbi:MAG: N-acetylmuramoyl-L-alanine amidase [Elusimicrobia bacterium]|nr:N-acetylmuramoyl-L-alanine amidase [Elusimicrobiota bacterium]